MPANSKNIKEKKDQSKLNKTYSCVTKYIQSIPKQHIYPIIILVLMFIGVAFGVSGSSIGMYHAILSRVQDPALIAGEPRGIRGDEWELITSKTIAQSHNNYDSFNENIGVNGENVSLRPDVPTNDINTIFRPQNWAFFILPLDNAIAYKWWFFTALVLISGYYFVRRFFTKSIPVAILLGLLLVFSPLPQWTYREFIFLVIGFGFIGIMLADWLQRRYYEVTPKKVYSAIALRRQKLEIVGGAALLAYVAVAYALVLYPPMQISVALVLVAFYVDTFVRRKRRYGVDLKKALKAQRVMAVSVVLAVLIFAGLLFVQRDTVSAIKDTEHPGVRHFESGWSSQSFGRLRNLLVGGSVPLVLQKDTALKESDYFSKTDTGNQSEASNYPWLLPFILLAIAYAYIRSKRSVALPVATIGVTFFVIVWMLVPGLALPVIDQVHPNRWNLSVGLLSFLLLGSLAGMSKFIQPLDKSRLTVAYLVAGLGLIVLNLTLFASLNSEFPLVIGKIDAIIFALMAVAGPLALLAGYYKSALLVIVVVGFGINMNVNPLYLGTSSATNTKIVQKIQDINEADPNPGRWVMAMNVVSFEHVPLLAGVKSVNTHFSYPQEFWKLFDPEGKQDKVYNRAAHLKVELTDEKSNIYLVSTNTMGISLNPCEDITKDLGIEYVVTYSDRELYGGECLDLVGSAEGAGTTVFNIYRVSQTR